MASFAEWTEQQKKKKKKEELTAAEQAAAGKSFTEYTKQVLGRDDIEAPLSERKKDDDIAPVVTTTEKEDDRKWFQKGLFEDGYQFGDITKTILGTGTDVTKNATAGVVGMGEKILDAGMTLGALMNRSTMNQAAENEMIFNAVTGKATDGILERYQGVQDEVEKETSKFVAKDLYDEEKVAQKIIEPSLAYQGLKALGAEDEESFSVLGEKSDALVQSAGQLGATAALQAVGVPWWLTTGATTFGSEAEQAFNEGATFDEAVFSSAVSAGAEILTEKISGGISFGGGALDDVLTKELGRVIANKTARTLVKLGVDAAGEGFEEILSGALSAVGQKMSYAKEKDFNELFSSEEAFESFIGGAVLGGGSSVINAVKSKSSGVDAVTGFTDNEQKVVDKVYQDRVAEAEENGKITESEKRKIYNAVLNDFEKGYISTDTIEEVLGGDTYKTYKDTIDDEDAQVKELEEQIKELEAAQNTVGNAKKYDALTAQLEELKTNSQRDQLKQQLGDEVFNLTKDSRLVESYNERARRGMAFEADLSKYDAKQQKVIQKAVDSGILNNTRRTHEFVDMVAKISADKGVLFDFTDNAKLKESGFAINGAQVNGYVTKDGVTVNIDSAKSLNSVVGHEITHILEGTELYTELQSVLFEYAKAKKDYQSRYDTLAALYKDVEGADVNAELTADLVGDYLFTDSDFISRLSTEHRNVFQKIYDEVKYLLKVATAGSAEARELEKVKRAFDKAYKANGTAQKNTATEGGVVYSLQEAKFTADEIQKIQNIGRKSVNNFNAQDIAETEKFARKYWNELGTKSPFYRSWFGDWRANDETKVQIATQKGDARGVQKNGDTGWDIQVSGKVFNETNTHTNSYNTAAQPYLPYINDIVQKAVLLDSVGVDPNKQKSPNSLLMHSMYAVADIGNGAEILKLYVEEMNNPNADDTSKRAYQLQNIEKYQPAGKSSQNTASPISPAAGTVKTIADLFAFVKSLDKNFNPNNSSKIVNDDGTPKVMYHGSPAQFTKFDKSKAKSGGHYGKGFYFTDSESHAGTYGNLYSVYLNIRNPLSSGSETVSREQVRRYLEEVAENEDYSIENYGTYDIGEVLDIVMGAETSADAFKVIQDINATAIGDMVEAAELFNSVNGTTFDGIVVPTETVAFYPEQIKSATDNIGTFDKSNPDIRYSLSAEADKSYLEAANRGDVATAQKMVDEAAKEAGYDRLMFHETDADNIHIFDVARGTHGGTDSETPYGIFTKTSVKNIGLGGKQMALYCKAKNTLNVENRAEVKEKIPELIPYYDEIARIDKKYDALSEEYEDAEFDALQEWMEEHPDVDMDVVFPTQYIIDGKPADIDSPAYLDAHNKHVKVMEEWKSEYNKVAVKCKEIITEHLRNNGYDSMYFKVDGGSRGRQTDSLILLDPNQVKSAAPITRDDNGNVIPLSQRFNAGNDDIRYSLSAEGETPKTYGNYNVRGKDIALETAQEVAPVQEDVAPVQDSVQDAVQVAPKDEADELISAIMDEEFRLQGYDKNAEPDYAPTTEEEANALAERNLQRITDNDMPPEAEAPYQGESKPMTANDPFAARNWHERGTKAFITENPDAKRFFQEEAQRLADDYAYTMPAERGFSDEQYYNTNGEKGFYGWSRKAADDINTLIDVYGLSYAQIEEGLDAIINDTDKVNNKPAKTIEFILNDRMLKGYETYYSHEYVTPNQGYIEWLNGQRQAEEYRDIASTITDADAPMVDDVAPVAVNSKAALAEIANNGRRDNLKGAYMQDGKQYIADGSFIAEFNTVDNSLTTAKDFPAKKVLAELNEAEARQTEGNYSIDGEAIAALNNGTRNFIKVGDSLFDAKYVDAIISAIDSPVFTMSNVHGGDNALFVVGSNGRAVLMPVRAGDNVSVSYEAQPITDLTVEDVMPIAEDIAPVKYEAIKPQPKAKEPRMVRADNAKQQTTAKVLTAEPKVEKKKRGVWSMAKELVFDNGMVFEDIAKKTKNRNIEAKWNFIRYAENNAQHFIKEGASGVKSLDAIREQVEKTGKTEYFYNYLYHCLNIDRMTLENRYEGAKNKPVFGDNVTADRSRQAIAELEKENPEFKRYAKDVYAYMNHLRSMMVENGVISQETADLWAEMYPHFVPIRRVGDNGLSVNVPLDTGRTGVNAPVKRATGGNRDILPLFDTIGQRTIQTFKAVAKNSFGVELKNALGTAIESDAASVDDVIDSVDTHEELLQEGKNGRKPTFTVFEGGEKVTFEITDEMYDAMKPTSNALAYTNKVLNKANDIRRGLLTEYNPTFLFTNAIKDMQDVLINSQHPAKTYAKMPQAISELTTKGKWYAEYMANGGEQNSYFDNDTNTFKEENATLEALKKWTGLGAISNANNFIERIPRLAEYIASREAGASVEVAMLDAARVTTNFAAGGKLTKMLNRNGFTFLNASMQGAVQQVRNIREAKMKGLKGWAGLAAKFAVAGLASSLLNHLLWDDDEEYEELSDYVKDNYYIVAKYGDGQFVRIPKGRAVAVIQNAFEQMENAITGDDEVDLGRFTELVVSNLAPNNPLDNNLLAPIMQVASNKTWYGDDLVPTRLQDVPAVEQYDETTDSISRWLGEKTGTSPYKWNYLLDQYSGGVGDTLLPMLTPAAERGDTSGAGNLLAPFKDKFTTDSVLKNQNVSDFYDTVDELTVNANASGATEEDVLKYKYINSVNAELSDLYKQKREIQNSDLSDDEKYAAVRDLQQQIVDIAKEGLNTYNNVDIYGEYASVGDREYRWYEPSEGSDAEAGWQKITDKQAEKQDNVTSALGISKADYWSNKEEYDYAYEYPEKYAVAKAVGGYTAYKGYSSELYDIKADKDEDGKSISGSRKEKVIEYINNLDADYGERIILFKSEYNADDTYNYDIIEYLNGRDDISYDEMVSILKELGFTVTADGSIYW